jgi:hypothetical protein
MFIKSLIEAVDRIIHNGKIHPVVNGIADVPQEVRDELVAHTHWEDNTDEIADETLKQLEKAKKVAEKANKEAEKASTESPDKNNETETK